MSSHEHVVIELDVIVHDVDLVGKDGDVRGLGGRRRGVILDGDHFLFDEDLGGVLEDSHLRVLGRMLESCPHDTERDHEADLREEQFLVLQAGFFGFLDFHISKLAFSDFLISILIVFCGFSLMQRSVFPRKGANISGKTFSQTRV